MLAYAEGRQRIGERGSSPSTMLLIVGIHIAAVAVAMSMKMIIDPPQPQPPIKIDLIKTKPPSPPPPVPATQPVTKPMQSTIDRPVVIVPTPTSSGETFDSTPMPTTPIGLLASNNVEIPKHPPAGPVIVEPVRTGPRLNTPESALKPPYPASKLDSQQEASLRLQLSIDERGRVTAVQPVGSVDRAFFEAARKHLIARWRYRPATVDGSAVASSTTITLRFELEG